MRVNITYSVEMDKIPEKVSDFLLNAAVKSSELVRDLNEMVVDMCNDFSIEKHLERMDKIRLELAGIDHTMLDCSEILHGYQKALVQLREPQISTEENHHDETRNEKAERG